MVFSAMYTICGGPKLDAQRFRSITSVNCQSDTICQSKSFFKVIYIITFNVAHWNT